ncbi:T9SS type A sorting domain-containing protein [Pontibacter sp. G13]|uniref:T9SS type A sorting domain-containing protein n=1 Tax=Pontibacter sp. G13 TaxID=3074898 RepID=UPI00288C428E|nr:T9SS type A sorting domain-containing protein [Pontibacter sp. G13]WNJ19217.1 T9SS type A sorting domain-containing protein [Pontibacter sp. G13]
MKSTIFIFLVICLGSFQAIAQASFQGGEGDGHAMAEMQGGAVSTTTESQPVLSLYPNPSVSGTGSVISWRGVYEGEKPNIFCLDVLGRIAQKWESVEKGDRLIASGLDEGVYFLRIIWPDGTTHQLTWLVD